MFFLFLAGGPDCTVSPLLVGEKGKQGRNVGSFQGFPFHVHIFLMLGRADNLGTVDAGVSGKQISRDAGQTDVDAGFGAKQLDAHQCAGHRCVGCSGEYGHKAHTGQ